MIPLKDYKLKFYDLPLTRLHVLEVGEGPPLIIVPATISECRDWIPLARFMGQWFHVYFFELPGHGESTPFQKPFTTDLVVDTVAQLVDHLSISRFNVMGFSFGGILALKSFYRLRDRIDRIIFLAPCLSHRAVVLSKFRKGFVLNLSRFFNLPPVRRWFLRLLHNPHTVTLGFRFLQKIGKLESTMELRPKLLTISETTLEVLGGQVNEILTVDIPSPIVKSQIPCFFWMSVNDPVLDFNVTFQVIQDHFDRAEVVRSDVPYHQPPEPFTFDGLNRDYYSLVNGFLKP